MTAPVELLLTDLTDVSPAMVPVVIGSRVIVERAIDEATGTTRGERRAAIDRVVDAFRDRHYRYVLADRKAVPR